jgi:molybdate transport system substrate-binding protein
MILRLRKRAWPNAVLACSSLIAWYGIAAQEPRPAASPKESEEAATTKVLVSAAASTKEVMETLAGEFAKKSKATIKINPGPSSGLASQIIEGAPADLFLSANREWAKKVAEAELAESPKELLTNKLVLIVPKGNPAKIKEPKDLLAASVKKIALAGEKVPAGEYANQALTRLELLDKLSSGKKIARAQDVRGALSFVERGEAEAGIVYSTDAIVASGVQVVYEFDPKLHEEIVYVLVLLKHGSKNAAARSFFDYLQSDDAAAVYAKAGFSRFKPRATND